MIESWDEFPHLWSVHGTEDGRWFAACQCGWRVDDHYSREAALDLLDEHCEQTADQLRSLS